MNSNPKNYENPNVVPSQTPIPPITKPLFASVLHPKKATPPVTPLVIPVHTTSLKDQDFITIEDSSTVILLKVKDVESMGNIYAIYKNAGFLDLSTNNVEDVNKVVKDAEVANSVEDDSIDDLNDLNENLNNLGHDFMDMENLENAFPIQPDTLIKEENFAQHQIQKDEEEYKITRLELFWLKTMWGNFDFDYACSMAHGRFGGIISIWDPNTFSKEEIWCDDSFIIVKGHWKNSVGIFSMINAIPDIHITALDHLWSDHTPILFHVKKSNFGPSPFKLYNSWLLRDSFDDLIRSTWSSMENHSNDRSHMSHKTLRSIKGSIKQWHNNIKINDRNKRLEALNDLKFIDKKIDEGSANENDRENRIKLLQDIDNLDNLEAHGIINQKRRSQSITVPTTRIPAGGVVTTEAPGLLPVESLELNRSMSVPSVEGSTGAIYQPGFKQEVRLFKKAKAQVARRNERIHVKEEEIKRLGEEVESLKAVETEGGKHYVEMDARLDTLSIDFDEELYPHMLTAIAGRRWVIRHGLRLAVMKCAESIKLRQTFAYVVSTGTAKGISEGLEYRVKQGEGKLDLAAIEAYDAEADDKYIAALHALKDLKYPLVDHLDTGEDAPQWIRDPLPSSSQLTIPVYPKVHNHEDPWAFKEEILFGDAIAANISRAKKKKKCRVVCRTHGISSAYHARSNGVLVSVPTVVPQGLAILLADVTTQTDISEYEASPKLL
ncbi:hypothetical protein Tco_1263322 [Tanacetum coccineum]